MVPVFITVDPERDTVEQVREYVKGKFLNDIPYVHIFLLKTGNYQFEGVVVFPSTIHFMVSVSHELI